VTSVQTPLDNLVYDLVSIEYHALKGQHVYDKYARDAQGREEVRQFIDQVKQEDQQRAMRAHELIRQLMP